MISKLNYHEFIYKYYDFSKAVYFEQYTDWLYYFVKEKEEVFDYDKLTHHKKVFKHFQENRSEKINLFIVGEGNYGKSSLINAIVKGVVAEIDFLPNTWCINRYKYGKESAEIFFTDKNKLSLSHIEAKRYLKEEENKSKLNNAYNSNISEINWYYQCYPILEQFSLIDTPGLDQLRTILSEQSIENFYYKADCVLWLLDGKRINSESTNKNLNKVIRYSKKIVGVINKWDDVENKSAVMDKAKKEFGKYFISIIPVSAKIGMESLADSETYNKSLIPSLLSVVESVFLRNSLQNKNIQLYHSIRLSLNEANGILKSEEISQNKNYNTYKDNLNIINSSQENTSKSILAEIENLHNSFFKDIYMQINTHITFNNAVNSLNTVILENNKIISTVDSIMYKAQQKRDSAFYNLIQKLSVKKYIDLQYDYDGSIISKSELTSIGTLPQIQKIYYSKISIFVEISGLAKFIETLSEVFEGIPFIGGGIKDYRIKKQNELRTDICSKIRPQQKNQLNEMKSAMNSNLNQCFHLIKTNYTQHFNFHFKSLDSFENRMKSVTKKKEMSFISNNMYICNLIRSYLKGIKNEHRKASV